MIKFIKIHKFIILILFLSFLRGILWMITVPALQTPDADRHFSTILWYAEPQKKSWDIKKVKTSIDPLDTKTYNIPERYKEFLETIQFDKNRFSLNRHQAFQKNSQTGPGEEKLRQSELDSHFKTTPPTIVNYPFLYYEIGSWVYNLFKNCDLLTRLYAVKFYTLFLGLAAIFTAYKTALLLNFSKKNASLFAGITAFQPMLSFMNISINVDSLLILGMFMFIYFSISILKKSWNWKNISGIVLACLIANYSKFAGAIVFPFLAILIFFALLSRLNNWKNKLFLFLSGLPLLLVLTYFIAKSMNLSLNILAPSAKLGVSFFEAAKLYLKKHFFLYEQYEIFGSYWGWFGWFDFSMNKYIYLTILIIFVIGLFFFVAYLLKKNSQVFLGEKRIYIYLSVLTFIFHCAIVYSEFNYFKRSGIMFGLQGRYFLPMLLPLLLIIVKGYDFLFKKFDLDRVLITLFFLMVLLNLASLFGYIMPAYYL